MRGRGGAARGGIGADDSDLESLDTTESSESSSDSECEGEEDIPIPRSRRQHIIRVIRGRHETAVGDIECGG